MAMRGVLIDPYGDCRPRAAADRAVVDRPADRAGERPPPGAVRWSRDRTRLGTGCARGGRAELAGARSGADAVPRRARRLSNIAVMA